MNCIEDKCYWVKRAVAMERALKESAPCLSCFRLTTSRVETCGHCKYWSSDAVVDGWLFDDAKFRVFEGG